MNVRERIPVWSGNIILYGGNHRKDARIHQIFEPYVMVRPKDYRNEE